MNKRIGDDAPLHEMNPTGRFSDRAADYVKFRPGYPDAALDAILSGLSPQELIAADVGAGTGISSRILASRGVRVHAVEPNTAMVAAAAPHPLVTWHSATAESTGLEAGSVDLVLCAQSFHWMRQPEALREFHRILKRGGRLALMWNERDPSDSVMAAYRDAILSVGGGHPTETREFDPSVVDASGFFRPLRPLLEVPSSQQLDERGLIGRAQSASYAPKSGPEGERLVRRLRELFVEFKDSDGQITLKYTTRVWLYQRTG